jgi:hypothetical protein
VSLSPALPAGWGEVRLDELRLGPVSVNIRAAGDKVDVSGLPDDWRCLRAAD